MVSIVIIVKNDRRIDNLLKKLESIRKPIDGISETIVVDASNDMLDDIKIKHSGIKWFKYKTTLKKRTYSEQRNIGIKLARAEIIVFIDADCIPNDLWLVELIKPIYFGEELITSGACYPVKKHNYHKLENFGEYRDECPTMNMALSKLVIQKIGLFDESLEGAEDSDYSIRARRAGFRIKYVPNSIVYHDFGGFRDNILRSYLGGNDRISLYKKHPKIIFSRSPNNLYSLYYLLFLITFPLLFLYPQYLLILFLPSIYKLRNPTKEIFNIAYALGMLKKLLMK